MKTMVYFVEFSERVQAVRRQGIDMRYQEGSYGRVFLLRFDDRDDLLGEIRGLAAAENIRAATVMLLGGMRTAGVVSGPRQPVVPPDPMWVSFSDGREVIGFGTLFRKGEEPVIHLHGAIGRGSDALVGCIRKDATAYLVIEAVVAEITGIDARKTLDERTGLVMLEL